MKRVLSILCAAVLVLLLAACGSTETGSEDTSSQEQETEQVIYEDDYLKATYEGVSETSGVVIMTVKLENKTEGEITVLPMDSSVDGVMVQFTSGTLATIQGGKTFNQGWIIGSVPTDNIEFSMLICDENMSELVQTETLTIEMK